VISFNYENPRSVSRDRVNAVEIRITKHINYGTSAYPLLVWWAVQKEPQTQNQIIRTISEAWDTVIDRKAVGRHLQLLQDLGFPVQHGPDGYYYNGEPGTPKTDIKYSPSAYPLLILQELDHTPKTQTAIIQSIQEKYGTKIDRKAVRRHLELLEALGLYIEKCEDGYYIGK
jgi:biotin operon repressor